MCIRDSELGDLVDVKGGKRLPKGSEYSSDPTEHPYIRVTDFKSGEIDESDLRYLSPEAQQSIERYIVAEGDVVISIAGSIGQIASVPASLAGANLTENAAKLVRHEPDKLHSEFLAAFLRSRRIQDEMIAKTGQVTIGKLALFRIASLKMALPQPSIQMKFESAINGHRAARSSLARSGKKLDDLFASLQKRAFRGEL